MGPVKNPPSPQSNLKKDHSSSVSEEMAPAAKSRRLLNACLMENQNCYSKNSVPLLDLQQTFTDGIIDDKKMDETTRVSLDISYTTNENNENAMTTVQKNGNLNSLSNAASVTDNDLSKCKYDITATREKIIETMNGDTENDTGDYCSDDHKSIENHNSNTSSAPEEMNSPMEIKEKISSLADWAKEQLNSTLELSNSVKDTLSDMIYDGNRFCQETTRQFANTYFSQTSSNVDKMIDQQSSQGGQSYNQTSTLRRCTTSLEREHKFFDHYLKPHLKALKTELEVDSDTTDDSSDDEVAFPPSSTNIVSGNESSSLPQSPASTISDFSTLSASADHSQMPWHAQSMLEKTFPAERNYLRRRADMHSMWVWLAVKFKDRKRQLKKLNQILISIPRHGFNNNTVGRRRDQLTRSSSPESTCTPTNLTGPPTPVSMSDVNGTDADGQNSSNVNGCEDPSMTSARVRPFTVEKSTSGVSPSRPQHSRTIRPCVLSRCSDLLDSIAGPSTVQCHCQYPEVYPCILCCGTYVDRELNPSTTAKSSRLQLPPAEKIYPRHKLDLSYHEKLSRSSDCCHSLSYDESFVSRRPRMVYFSQSRSQQSSPQVPTSQPGKLSSSDSQDNSSSQPKHPPERSADVKEQVKCPDSDERLSDLSTKLPPKRGEQVCHNSDHHNSPETEHRLDYSTRVTPHASYLRRKRGRRKQHPYSRSTVQQNSNSSFYAQANESMDYRMSHDDDRRRIPANFCKQRLGHQIHQQSRNRSFYRQQWHHNQTSDQQGSFRHRHQPQHYQQTHRVASLQQSRKGVHNRMSHHSHQHDGIQSGQKVSGNRPQTNAHRSKNRRNFDVPISETSASSLSSRSNTVSHAGVNMCNFVVNIASVGSGGDTNGSNGHPSLTKEQLSRRQSVTTLPAINRRPLGMKVGLLSRGSSIPDEDTASVSSSGGSVKSMRSVCSSRLEMRRRSEDSSVGSRAVGVTGGQGDNRHQTDIETPLWRRLPAGISAVHKDSAVMHLLSVGGVGASREHDIRSSGGTDSVNTSDMKILEKDSTAYHLMMLDDTETNLNEDTSDRRYLLRHKIGEVTERTANAPTNNGSHIRPNAMEDLYLQPGEFRDQVRR